ncbi:MAG TPA: ATP-binding cassette domain-containing protein [Kineosporiaceae bacterium]
MSATRWSWFTAGQVGVQERPTDAQEPLMIEDVTLLRPPEPQGPDDFTVYDLIGEGVTARVYHASHPVTSQQVALKIWKTPTRSLDDDARRRFRRECRTLQTLSQRSDRIVGYVWSGLTGEFPWLAMDLCETSLGRRLAAGPLPVQDVLDLADDVLVALGEIHAAGHLHRNIQPDNVLLREGHAVVGDFAVALGVDAWPQDLSVASDGFVAPEVEAGGVPTVHSDLYSVGRTLRAALPAQLPGPLASLLARVTSVDPHGRPTSAHDLQAALRDLRAETTGAGQDGVEGPRVMVTVDGRSCTLTPGRSCALGRGPQADLDVRDPMISRCHARVEYHETGWRVVDLGSTNGLWHGGVRVDEVAVTGPITVLLGGAGGVPLAVTPLTAAPHRPVPERLPVVSRPEEPASRGVSREMTRDVLQAALLRRGYPESLDDHVHHPYPHRWEHRYDEYGGRDDDPRPRRSGHPGADAPGRVGVVHPVPAGVVRIGRSPVSDVVLTDLMVSMQHAELRSTPDGPQLRDLGSTRGTYVNGVAVRQRLLAPGDLIAIGPHTLAFDGTQLVELDESAGVELAVGSLSVTLPDGRSLLSDISFRLPPRTLMAIVGSSGSGKSTLLNALAGLRPATGGTILYGGRDLYAEFGELRQRIGYVPQQDVLHHVLTVEQALGFAARLRFPLDTSQHERTQRVREVADELSLSNQLHTRIGQLSGGERRRASTAMELLTKPALLFLDEPTSGLDADLDRDVMDQLRSLADDGRTVVVVTHTLDNLSVCDLVMVMAPGGQLAYLGPPDDAFDYFGVSSWADLFALLKSRPGEDWAERFQRCPGRDRRADAPVLDHPGAPPPPLPPLPRRSVVSQWSTLVRRQLAVTAADRTLLALLVAMPAVVALLTLVIPAKLGLSHQPNNREGLQLLLVLAVGAGLIGAAGSMRELVRERALFHRERAVGLSTVAYLSAKITVLTSIAALQGSALTALALSWRLPPDHGVVLRNPITEVAIAVSATAIVSALFGLAMSAAARDESQIMPLLVVLTMAQLVMCGGMVPIDGRPVLDQLSRLLPARWGLAATASTVDLRFMCVDPNTDPLWAPGWRTWWLDIGVLTVLGLAAIAITLFLVRRGIPSVSWAQAARERDKAAEREQAGWGPAAVGDRRGAELQRQQPAATGEQARLLELETEVRELRLERELLARAATFLAKNRVTDQE